MKKPPEEAKKLIEEIAQSSSQWMVNRSANNKRTVAATESKEDESIILAQLTLMSKKIVDLSTNNNKCQACGGDHKMLNCDKIRIEPRESEDTEDANYLGNWRSNPIFNNNGPPFQSSTTSTGFNRSGPRSPPAWEEALTKAGQAIANLANEGAKYRQANDTRLSAVEASVQRIEGQLAQLSEQIKAQHVEGILNKKENPAKPINAINTQVNDSIPLNLCAINMGSDRYSSSEENKSCGTPRSAVGGPTFRIRLLRRTRKKKNPLRKNYWKSSEILWTVEVRSARI
ncbi:UNVERIFIED_CONTAM: hypothetical protein ITH36_24245 [Salmonella enterica subsp. enterica serovar Weltevreden]